MTLWTQTEVLSRHVNAVYTDALVSLRGITIVEAHVLAALHEHNGQRATDLAAAAGRRATSFTPTLDALEAAGYLLREPNAKDRRAVRVMLTRKGVNTAQDAAEALRRAEETLVRTLHEYLPDVERVRE